MKTSHEMCGYRFIYFENERGDERLVGEFDGFCTVGVDIDRVLLFMTGYKGIELGIGYYIGQLVLTWYWTRVAITKPSNRYRMM